jgi:hypothetical protein
MHLSRLCFNNHVIAQIQTKSNGCWDHTVLLIQVQRSSGL